ncbi:MAG: helix-turn-helix transcriptional regulator [Chloroflexota bacterium]|nr:helix-turn-helix transcriptional regulator [Chloroflexota bacterium]
MASIYDPRYADLRRRLRAARLRAGLTQVEAASRLGKNQQYINRCEAGDRRVDFLEILDFAVLYECPLESFIPSSPSDSIELK